ncbi:MAG TPA: hypothetical protein VG406_04645 [Isosphaeraceae bacterium]|jgi:glycosyltransferase involved in cell wall biosynthesis|nr:hypothetical protein [Isosphaeraceae bacterium]
MASPTRPVKFLVSTTDHARDVAGRMGCADYSYTFVLKALAPALEAVADWTLVDRAESRLPYHAARARAGGSRPIHLALHPVHNAYLTPGLPTILYPFWEFSPIPDRDFGLDTRQNWARVADRADLIVTACRFTAESFRRAGVVRPLAVVPVPLADAHFDVPDWDPGGTTTLHCRHAFLGDGPAPAGPPAGRAGWGRHVRPWLSDEALVRIARLRQRLTRTEPPAPPVLPRTDLHLSGLVFTSIFNLGDRRKNVEDMLTAFLLAFRDDPGATLVLKLATNPAREHHDLGRLRAYHAGLGLRHACRVAVVTDFLDDGQMAALTRATTYYVNTSRAEGACLPLQQALAGGRPALAPAHTAMADYMDGAIGFVVASDPEPTHWPHDPSKRGETHWHRLDWSSLFDQYRAAAAVATGDLARYYGLARHARDRMARLAGLPVAAAALRRAVDLLPLTAADRLDWAA